jgi:hypothetical protein
MPNPICGNKDCKSSTGIHGLLTHGTGQLDSSGFWEIPCPETYGKHVEQDVEIYQMIGELGNIEYLRALVIENK